MGLLVFPCTNPCGWLPALFTARVPCCRVLHLLVPCLLNAVSAGVCSEQHELLLGELSEDRKRHVGFSRFASSVTLLAVTRFGVSSQGKSWVLFRRLAEAWDVLKVCFRCSWSSLQEPRVCWVGWWPRV